MSLFPSMESPALPRRLPYSERVSPSWKNLFLAGFVGAAGVLAALGAAEILDRIAGVIMLCLLAVFVAVVLSPAVNWLSQWLPRGLAILSCYLLILALLAGIGAILLPPVISGVQQLAGQLPAYAEQLSQSQFLARLGLQDKLSESSGQLAGGLLSSASLLQGLLAGTLTVLFQLIAILVVSVMLLLEGRGILDWLARHSSQENPKRSARLERIRTDIGRAVGGYVAGLSALCLLAGSLTFLVLTLLGVPSAAALALFVALCGTIPLLGSLLGGATVALVCALHSSTALLLWLLFYLIYQQLENNLLQPLIFRRSVSLSPLAVILSVLIGGTLMGVVGALLAIPAAASLQVVLNDWWEERQEEPPPISGARASSVQD